MSEAGVTADADVKSIDGIGQTYAEHLHDAGVETIADLANADADSLTDDVDAGTDRLHEWIERANEIVEANGESTGATDDGNDGDDGDDGEESAGEDGGETHDSGDRAGDTDDERAGPLAVRRAVETTAEELIGRTLDGVVEVARDDDGWRASVEVIERASVPDTQDILGLYEITLDEDGDIRGYRRTRRYRRSDTSTLD